MLASLLMGGLGGIGNFFAARAQANAQKEMQAKQIAANAALQNQDIASKESQLDPFRQQMAQARNLGILDMRQNYQPAQPYGMAAQYQQILNPNQTPTTYASAADRKPLYTPSPDLLNWLSMIKQNIAGGQNQAPTMTNPANYGKTSALDLLALSSNPASAAYARGANNPPPPVTMLPPGRRRDDER